jgi:hypothetical protein|nr:MAG TPA: NTP-PPase-like protein [Caudoviricetes sp.]
MKTIQELVPLIQEWAKERKIYEELTPFDELLKTHEEVGELIKACYENDKLAIKDAIGDVLVTLINYCYMVEEDIESIFSRTLAMKLETEKTLVHLAMQIGIMLPEMFKYEYNKNDKNEKIYLSPYFCLLIIFKELNDIALLENSTLEECLNISYNEIKNRTGKMINGKFVKDE